MKKIFFVISVFLLSSLSTVYTYADGWQRDNVGWWYRYNNGSYPTSRWFSDERGDWYYANRAGYVLTDQWFQDSGLWYYLDGGGKMLTNQWLGNYYLGSSGYMLTDTVTPDGYRVGADGAWVSSSDSYVDIYDGEFALLADDIDHFDVTDSILNISGTFYTYDETTYTDRYIGYQSEIYGINAGTSYYEKERSLSFGETTRQNLLDTYRAGYVNVVIIKVQKGVVRELSIQTRRH